jgi:hypothetical protein
MAEIQAAEELRRKDPVKRAMWVGALLAALMLVWASSVQMRTMLANRELSRVEGLVANFKNDYQQVVQNQTKLAEARHKITELNRMSTNRLLQANILNEMQKTTVDDVQLIHYKVEQIYAATEGGKAKTNADGKITPGKPATATEHVVVALDGSDTSPTPGDQVTKFQRLLAANGYFQTMSAKSNAFALKNISNPEFLATTGKRGVNFTLECRYPETTR